jgi:hypothetical protein
VARGHGHKTSKTTPCKVENPGVTAAAPAM